MEYITRLGDMSMIWVILAALFLCIKSYRKTGAAMAVALLIGYVITNLILKNFIMRARPYDTIAGLHSLIGSLNDFSFPSGHTTSSIAAGFVMLRTLPRYVGIPAIVLAVLISFSRLYVGVHYPTDVLVGAAIGLFAAFSAKYIEKV
jgi:undecaprenyl-diphosphatase